MGGDGEAGQVLTAKFEAIFPHLDERQRRLLMGAEARALGHGGIRLVARAAGVREATVSLGVTDLDSGAEPLGRARKPALAAAPARTGRGRSPAVRTREHAHHPPAPPAARPGQPWTTPFNKTTGGKAPPGPLAAVILH